MVIGEQTARRLWPNADPIGEHVRIGDPDKGPWRTIVGVVGDVRHREVAAPTTMQMYLPQAQVTDSLLTVVIRTNVDPSTAAADVRRSIASIAPDVPVSSMAPLSTLVAKSVAPRRFVMILLELFGAVAIVMTAIGVYGVISYSVAERTREIGIRSALGASAGNIVVLVFGGGLQVIVAGLGIGVVAAIGSARYLASSLYDVPARDPITFVTVTLVLFAVAVAAQAVPIARAMKIAPNIALRQE